MKCVGDFSIVLKKDIGFVYQFLIKNMDKNDWNNTVASYGDIDLDWIAIWISDKTLMKRLSNIIDCLCVYNR